jgi:hypothetical protein|tara:strand:+ start:126 stop:416 length:291 start_codon:yes stop_codon:yes gene_type:complete
MGSDIQSLRPDFEILVDDCCRRGGFAHSSLAALASAQRNSARSRETTDLTRCSNERVLADNRDPRTQNKSTNASWWLGYCKILLSELRERIELSDR